MIDLSLIRQSIALDGRFIKVSKWSYDKKLRFLYAKYLSIIRHFRTPFVLAESSVSFDGQKLFYDSNLGLAGYQSMLSRHQYMLQVADVNVPSNAVIIDCGANVGFFSLMINDVFPDTNIYALEPVPPTYESLLKNTSKYKNIRCFKQAISDSNGIVKMSFNKDDSVISHISKDGVYKVKAQTLDLFCKDSQISKIDILKIDTESFEAHVLRGAQSILSKTKYMFIEITIMPHGNYTISSLMKLLNSNSFDFQLIAYRNYSNKGEGEMKIMDCLMVNEKYNG